VSISSKFFSINTYFSTGVACLNPCAARDKPSELIPLLGEIDPLPIDDVFKLGGGGGG